jgi:surfactin synthase thioesterase subunit
MAVTTRWLAFPGPRPEADVRLFCLPFAGAGASAFREWPHAFGPRVEIAGVRLPGREQRISEPPVVEPAEIAAAIAGAVDRPFAIFGHSMGACLAFEVVRELRRTGAPLPLRLYASGAGPPHLPVTGPFAGLSTVDDHELMTRVAEGGGVPSSVLAVPELFALFLPVLRADLTWVDGYTYTDGPPLPVPVVAFAGETDPVAPPTSMGGWRDHTTAGLTLHTLPGGHFFVVDQLPRLAALIEDDLLRA